MILSHTYRFIFVKPKKTAGTSLEILLSQFCGPDDVITPVGKRDEAIRSRLGFRGPQNYRKRWHEFGIEDLRRLILRGKEPLRFYNHIPAADIKQAVGDQIWKSYLKISVVRNPFDYAISRYFWEKKRNVDLDFEEFLRAHPHVLTENRSITEINGRSEMDVLLRFEHLPDDLAVLSTRLGLPKNLGAECGTIFAKSETRPASAKMSSMYRGFPEASDIVRKACREELERHGYGIPDLAGDRA